tara:strand:+ start:260 stop:481 length:222 start_codon:yes stop_codon:yes gene_type:complete
MKRFGKIPKPLTTKKHYGVVFPIEILLPNWSKLECSVKGFPPELTFCRKLTRPNCSLTGIVCIEPESQVGIET